MNSPITSSQLAQLDDLDRRRGGGCVVCPSRARLARPTCGLQQTSSAQGIRQLSISTSFNYQSVQSYLLPFVRFDSSASLPGGFCLLAGLFRLMFCVTC